MQTAAVIPAAGRGKRLGAGTPKAFLTILGKPLLIHTLTNLTKAAHFTETIVAVHPKEQEQTRTLLKKYGFSDIRVVAGGATRAESVRNAVRSIGRQTGLVLIHDAARPLITPRLVQEALRTAAKADGAVTAIPISSTVKKTLSKTRRIQRTEDRSTLFLAQTPQVFKLSSLLGRYRILGSRIAKATDEAALFDGTRARVLLSGGDIRNIKITTPEDVELMKYYLGRGALRG